MVPAGALVCATGATGLGGGALYTGRGPVCGTIIRGAGGCGGPVTTGTGRGGATGAWGWADAVTEGAAGGGGATTEGAGGVTRRGAAATGGAGGGAVGIMAGATGAAGRSATGATTSGRGAGAGVGSFAAGIDGGAGGGVGLTTGAGGTTTGFAATGGATGRGGGATASFCWVIAFSTSPGREICDKSILVLISSSPRNGRADRADVVCASAEPRRWTRTFSASCSSSELEWVFFSVTPTIGRASRMALLLTSSSLARSLIRTLLIRPFLYPALCLGLHRSLTESTSCTRTPSKMSARAICVIRMTIQLFPEQSHRSARAPAFHLRRLRLLPSSQALPRLHPRHLRRPPLQ